MAYGLWDQINWLTTRVKRLCCAVENITKSSSQAAINNPPYFEVVWRIIISAWPTLSDANAAMNANFTSMVTIGNTQRFYGGSNITLTIGTNVLITYADILSINDTEGVVVATNEKFDKLTALQYINLPKAQLIDPNGKTFKYCAALRYVNLPSTTVVGNECFNTCTSLETLNINKCTTMGIDVFKNVSGLTITITLPAVLVTDPNIITLQSNSTVTIITV